MYSDTTALITASSGHGYPSCYCGLPLLLGQQADHTAALDGFIIPKRRTTAFAAFIDADPARRERRAPRRWEDTGRCL